MMDLSNATNIEGRLCVMTRTEREIEMSNDETASEESNRKLQRRQNYQDKPTQQISIFRSKIFKPPFILTTALLFGYLNSLVNQPELTVESHQLDSNNQIVGQSPSQLFQTPIQTIRLAAGLEQKNSGDDEGGFIMRAASFTAPQNESTCGEAVELVESTTTAPAEEQSSADESQHEQSDQRIPIDVNRPQFVTHDQLSLLNASTKDESINLSSGAGAVDKAAPSIGSGLDPIRRVQSSRAGMSKVSHVSSLLSDLFTYATRSRHQSSAGEEQNFLSDQQITSASVSNSIPAHSPQPTGTCPGVCRSILTASILCRNEIDAPCPSFLQKCCDKNDVSFNGTPVETSAPISYTDFDLNATALSDNMPQIKDKTTVHYQTSPTNRAATPEPVDAWTVEKTGANKQEVAPVVEQRIGSARNGTAKSEQPADALDFLLAATSRPSASIYFLSSGNESSELSSKSSAGESGSNSDQHVESNGGDKQQQLQVDDLAQSSNNEQGARIKQPASQSFDSPLGEKSTLALDKKSGTSSSTDGQQTNNLSSSQVVVVHTANGAIFHQANERSRRPNYANWTDYHLLMMQNRPIGQSVVYHSNTDPVKSFVENANLTRQQQQTTTTTTTTTTQQNIDLIPVASSLIPVYTTAVPLTTKYPVCSGFCMPKIHRRLCRSQSTFGTELGCEYDSEFCCSQANDGIKSISATPAGLVKSVHDSVNESSRSNLDEKESESQLKVLNDQHSGAVVSSKSRAQTSSSQPDRTNPSPQRAPVEQSTVAPKSVDQTTVDPRTVSNNNNQSAEQQHVGSVGNVLVELLDSWISGSGQSAVGPAVSSAGGGAGTNEVEQKTPITMDAHATNQLPSFMDPATNEPNEQQNDRRLGFDLRPQQHDEGQPAPESGLMTSDGSSEQVDHMSFTEGSTGSILQGQSRCAGYCTLPLFTMLCDSTYKSADCGSSQKCCIIGRLVSKEPDQTNRQPTVGVDQLDANRQLAQACRGACLPVYHSSLCTKPNQIQLDSPGCLPNFVCCIQPETVQDGTNHIEDLESVIPTSGSLANVDSNAVQAGITNEPQIIKDNSLFASLVPPPPPAFPIAANMNPEQQLIQEKNINLNDQFMAASGRQRQSSIAPGAHEQSLQQMYQQSATVRPSSPKTTQMAAQGIISQIYQMFKSNSSTKQRQRPQQLQQPQHYYQQQQMAHQNVNFMPTHMYDPYQVHQLQASAAGLRASNLAGATQAQQILFPVQPQNVLLSKGHFPASGYPTADGVVKVEMKQQNRNRFAQQHPLDQQQQQQQQFMPGHVTVNSVIQKFNPQHLQQPKNIANHNQNFQQSHQTNLYPFNDNNQLMVNEKFATTSVQSPTMISFSSPSSGTNQQTSASTTNQIHLKSTSNQIAGNNPGRQSSHQNPSAQLTSNFAFPSSNLSDRQRYHYNTADNAHQVAFNGAQKSQQFPFSGQPLAFGVSDANSVQKQQQQQIGSSSSNNSKQDPVSLQAGRPIGNGNQPTRSHQQQDQRNVAAGSIVKINGSGHDSNVDQTHVERQNAAMSRNPIVSIGTNKRQVGAEVGDANLSVQSTDNQPVREINSQATFLQQQQQQLLLAQKVNDLNRRSTANRSTTKNGATKISPTEVTSALLPALSSSSSNLNVMISGGPFIDLQRVNSSSQSGLRRQMGEQKDQQQSATLANWTADEVDDIGVFDNKDDKRFGAATATTTTITATTLRPPVIRPTQDNNLQPAMKAPTTATEIDDLSNSGDPDQQSIPSVCPSDCLAPFVSFNCTSPNYIDESFSCPNAGAFCCIKGIKGADTSNIGLKQDSTTQASAQELISLVDNGNKLDSAEQLPLDERLDYVATPQQQQQPQQSADTFLLQSVVNNDPSLTDTETGSQAQATTNQQSSLVPVKNRFQATSCGLPGNAGRRDSGQARGRVMGGFDAKPGHWCWQAALMNNKNEYLCGGALIGTKWVLTAAHCVTQHLRSENQLFVRLGQHNLNNTLSSRRAKSIQVKTSYVHHNHNGITLDNDIALLRLEEPVELDKSSICIVCLPERSSQTEQGKRCSVTGYGFETESGPAALRVRQSELPIVADEECQRKTSAVLDKTFTLPANSFCAGGELGQDACHGDGGSPLSCLVDGYYELTGIVSWGYKCGSKDLPGLYSKVSSFVGWINQIVSVNN